VLQFWKLASLGPLLNMQMLKWLGRGGEGVGRERRRILSKEQRDSVKW
jgi:hypothetical protein